MPERSKRSDRVKLGPAFKPTSFEKQTESGAGLTFMVGTKRPFGA